MDYSKALLTLYPRTFPNIRQEGSNGVTSPYAVSESIPFFPQNGILSQCGRYNPQNQKYQTKGNPANFRSRIPFILM
jgi:hypothetical protein